MSRPTFDDADESAVGPLERVAGDELLHRRALRSPLASGLACMSKSSTSFHIGTRKHRCRCWPRYSCVICSSIAWFVFARPPNSGEAGSRTWKSIGPCLIWTMTLSSELAVERVEVVVGGLGAVVLGVLPIHFVVVDEAAIEEDAAVRLEGLGDDVGGVGVRAAVFGRAEPAFGVGLEHEAAEVGDRLVDFVDLAFPERDGSRIERIERVDAADLSRAGEVEREEQPHAPGAKDVGDAGDLGQHARARSRGRRRSRC